MTERGHTPPTFPPGDTEPISGSNAPSRPPSSLVSGNGYQKNGYRPDRQTRKVVRRLEKRGHHMVADVVRSYREHPAKGKRKSRIRWDNIAMYVVAILLPVLLVGGEWWRKYLWVGLCVTVIVSLVSKPRKRRG